MQIIGRDTIVANVSGWVHVTSAGLNHHASVFEKSKLTTTKAAKDGDNGIILTHQAGVHGRAIGEYCVAHILNIARRIPQHLELQKMEKWQKVQQKSLNEQVVGILGCGGIGMFAARFIRNFDIRVLATKRSIASHVLSDSASEEVKLTEMERTYVDEW